MTRAAKKLHESKIDEIADRFAKTLKEEARRLMKSGGIDPDSYSPEEYALAKICITAVLHQYHGCYAPIAGHHQRDLENLKHF